MKLGHAVWAFALACGGSTGAPTPKAPAPAPSQAPRIVVSIVIDQLGADTFARLLPYLPEEGTLRSLVRTGSSHTGVYPFAATYTACGHTAIYTGAPPRLSGIVSNKVWDGARGRTVPSLDDGTHAVLGGGQGFASPTPIRVETLADRLKDATQGRAKVVALSFKDRGAIPAAGKKGDLALWYDKSARGFVTSSFYAEDIPSWLRAFTEKHPPSDMLEPWTPLDADLLERVQGPDAQPGEGDWLGFGTTFPHDPNATANPWTTLRTTPRASEYLLDLAYAAAEEYGLGTDEIPDLLAVSISGPDYVGHVFGPHSWEYLDHLLRVDRALTDFLGKLSARGPLAVVVTSDHGAAPLAEWAPKPSGRIPSQALFHDLKEAVSSSAPVVAAWVQPFMHLSPEAEAPERRTEAIERIIAHLSTVPSLYAAYDVRALAEGPEPTDPITHTIWESLPPDAEGDVYVVPKKYYTFDEGAGDGSNQGSHGSPWDYDRRVPVLVAGPGVEAMKTTEPLDQARVTATLAALLRIDPPAHARALPLPGAHAP